MRIAIRHRYRFAEPQRAATGARLSGTRAWDELRFQSGSPFAVPATRSSLAALADHAVVRKRAEALATRLGGARVVASYGVGTGALEYELARLEPDLHLVITEFAPRTASRLAELLPEVDVRLHDLRVDGPVPEADLHLMVRIDTELTDHELQGVFTRFAACRVVFVATEVLGVRAVARELVTLLRGNATHAGWVRSRGALEASWRRTHRGERVPIHDLTAWLLAPTATDISSAQRKRISPPPR